MTNRTVGTEGKIGKYQSTLTQRDRPKPGSANGATQMKIPATELSDYIPANPNSEIQVLYANTGRTAFLATPAGIRAMARHNMIDGVVNRHRDLRFCVLRVAVQDALRLQRAVELPLLHPHSITKPAQHRGARQWVVRLDKAKTGLIGGNRAVFFPAVPGQGSEV